jgi:hypothetical protein
VVLFEDDRYSGRYARFDGTPGSPVSVPYVGGFINDLASSALIVRRFPNELVVGAAEHISQDTIRDLIKSRTDVRPRGNAVLTWDLWPTGPEKGPDSHPIAPLQAFVYIKIPITALVPGWLDYDAEIRYWLYPYVDSSGVLQVELSAYGAWVEGGIITDKVLSSLMGGIPSTFSDVDAQLSSIQSTANMFGPFRFVYLLPGYFNARGTTDEDVTLVLVQGTNPPDGVIF